MNEKIALVAALAVFGYGAANGLFMLGSPVRWADAFWTAKGVYRDPQKRECLSLSRERRTTRLAGGIMFLIAGYAFVVILGASGALG